MPAIPVHHTATVDEPWDGPAEEARLPNDAGAPALRRMYAWSDPNGDPATKAAYSFPHHQVTNGAPGAANLDGCRNGLSRVPQADIPAGDDAGVRAHLQAHLDDEESAEPNGPEDEASARLIVSRGYGHVSRALRERAWAIQPSMLTFMAEMLTFRASGGALSAEEIADRLAGAKAANGDRNGAARAGSVAVIPMYGVISQRQSVMSETSGGTSIEELRGALRQALADPNVSAVVLDIDSPGGSTDGMPEFAAELRQARNGAKPIVAQVDTLCASAAYWLASQCNEIAVTPSGEVGSIGVFAIHEDVSKAADMAGVKTTLISAGPFKTEGNQFEPLTDVARSAMQDQVDAFYSMFLADVAKGRGVSVDDVAANYGQGRTLLAKKAKAAGMADSVSTLEETVSRLQTAKATAKGRAALVAIHPSPTSRAAGTADPAWNQRMKGLLRR